MNIGSGDIKRLVVAALAILIIIPVSATTPIGGVQVGAMPTYEFDDSISLDFPDQPAQGALDARSGTLENVNTGSTKKVLAQGTDYRLVIYSTVDPNNDITVQVTYQNSTGNIIDGGTITTVGETISVNQLKGTYKFTWEQTNPNEVGFVVETTPQLPDVSADDAGFLGGFVAAFNQTVGYIGQLIGFAISVIVEPIAFVANAIGSVIGYLFNLTSWLFTALNSMITSAPVWAQPFMAVPVLIVGLELFKILFVTIDILWIG